MIGLVPAAAGASVFSSIRARNSAATKLLADDPTATVRVSIEITAEFADGASDTIKRSVSTSADTLVFKSSTRES